MVTTEFVIIFPILMAVMLFIAFLSVVIASTSDVQQIAHELARGSFRYLASPISHSDICLKTGDDLMAVLASQSFFLDPSKAIVYPCPGQPDGNGILTFEVEYNFFGGFVADLGRVLGFDVGKVTRRSTVYW